VDPTLSLVKQTTETPALYVRHTEELAVPDSKAHWAVQLESLE
jgi:hypothetical protein